MTCISRSAGICACTRSSAVFTPSMSSTVLAPDCRRISRVTVGTPFKRATERCSLVPSSARPMSETRTGVPSRVATTMLLKSVVASMRPSVRSSSWPFPCSTVPPGISVFSAATASRTSVMERP